MKKQGVKLFIFLMIVYFYDTHLKPDGGTLGFRNSDCGMRAAELRSKQCGDIEPSGGIRRNGGWETSKRQKAVCKVQNAELN